MSVNTTIQKCIILNTVLLGVIVITVYKFADETMLRVGYSKDLMIIGISIDTLEKYIIL
jgi:hypothetical protein